MSTITIGVLGTHRLFCETVSHFLSDDPTFKLAALDVTVLPLTDRDGIEVAVLDAAMPDVLRWCVTLASDSAVSVILVGAPENDDAWAEEALAVGVRGILTKTARAEELSKAIHVVAGGGIWARRRWLNDALKSLAASKIKPAHAVHLEERLSEREREVFCQAATGASNKELADRLAISEGTVKAHLTHIFHKLGVSNRTELAAAYHGVVGAATAGPDHLR